MHENSLFAILLRKAWWVSALVALGLFGVLRLFLPWDFSLLASLPFVVIAAYALWKQLRAPGARRIAKTLERARGMSWDEFAATLEAAYQRQGYRVTRIAASNADFELVQGARSTLVACKRWKAVRTGIEPLRELEEARRMREAHACIYVAAGEITEQARTFATEKRINLLQGPELATLLL